MKHQSRCPLSCLLYHLCCVTNPCHPNILLMLLSSERVISEALSPLWLPEHRHLGVSHVIIILLHHLGSFRLYSFLTELAPERVTAHRHLHKLLKQVASIADTCECHLNMSLEVTITVTSALSGGYFFSLAELQTKKTLPGGETVPCCLPLSLSLEGEGGSILPTVSLMKSSRFSQVFHASR